MSNSYLSNYIKIYFAQVLQLILGFISLFIVAPYLTNDRSIYGIYFVCTSLSIFMTYADFGFLNSGQKYSAIYVSRNDFVNENRIQGFTIFILAIFLFLLSVSFLFFSFSPTLVISKLDNYQFKIASNLFFILALSTPIVLFQRLIQLIYGARLKEYIIQWSNIFGNIIKICSVFFFFNRDKYDIVGYFVFLQIINLATLIFPILYSRIVFNYNYKLLVSNFNFNKATFIETKNLAFSGLYLTIAFIILYELDSVVIGRIYGPATVAIYSIALTILNFYRSLLGILFSPFNTRFNYFLGVDDENGLKNFIFLLIDIVTPLIIIPILTISNMSSLFVLSWLGGNYIDSINILKLLILSNFLAFIFYPTSLLLTAKEKLKELFIINTLLPILFWLGIYFTSNIFGVISFAIFKFLAFTVAGAINFQILRIYLGLNFISALKRFFNPIYISAIFSFLVSYFVNIYLSKYIIIANTKTDLLLVLLLIFIIILISLFFHYLISIKWRNSINNLFKKLILKYFE